MKKDITSTEIVITAKLANIYVKVKLRSTQMAAKQSEALDVAS